MLKFACLCFSSLLPPSHLLVILLSDDIQLTQILLQTPTHQCSSFLQTNFPFTTFCDIFVPTGSHLLSLMLPVVRRGFTLTHPLLRTTRLPVGLSCTRTQTLMVSKGMTEG